ncbi:MAG: DUF262 domain-containing protein [Acidimicrobiia bacterium]|nr:DUF262 domain-containing protein [Acidimicrobiia bacterium]
MQVSAILNNIELEQFALPEFQRGYVWGREQVRNLFSSLYRQYPVGGFLVWTTQPDPDSLRGDPSQSGAAVKLLLDGQQRATSLYGVMRGRPPKFFQGNARAFTGLHFNIRTETFEFYGPVKMRDDPMWISVTDLFQAGPADVQTLAERAAGSDSHAQPLGGFEILARLMRLLSISGANLHIEEIAGEDRTIDEVVEIFNRLNSGGTKLSKADLALARLCADSPKVRNELLRLVDRWAQAQFPIRLELLLRCVTTVATNRASFNALRKVSASEFDSALKRTAQSIDSLLNLFRGCLGIDHARVFAAPNTLPVLARLVAERGGRIDDARSQQRILYWYMHCFMWGRYSGSTETTTQRDLDVLEESGVDGLIDELNRWRGSLHVRPEDFAGSTIGARFYPLLYILTRANTARNLCDGVPLAQHMLGVGSRLEVHHIFPKRRLYDAEYDRSQVNALANFCFLTSECNKRIGARRPTSYLAHSERKNPGVLKSQWIPEQEPLWPIDQYEDFLSARRGLLADAANRFLNTLLHGGEPLPATTADITAANSLTSDLGEAPGDDEEARDIAEILSIAAMHQIAQPETHHEICDEHGEVLAIADIAWPQGIQPGRTRPVALLLNTDTGTDALEGRYGIIFTSKQRLVWHLEELLRIDIDNDQVIGDPDPASDGSLGRTAS